MILLIITISSFLGITSLISSQNFSGVNSETFYWQELKNATPDGTASVELIETAPSGACVSIGDYLVINYDDSGSPTATSVSTNLTDYGGSAVEQLFDDGTHGDIVSGDGNWTLFWEILDPYPYGIEESSASLTINASDGLGPSHIVTADIIYGINRPVDTISPTIDSLSMNFYNISYQNRVLDVGIQFSETMYYSSQNHNYPHIEFIPDISSHYVFYDRIWSNSNSLYNITYSFSDDEYAFFNIDINISNTVDSNFNPLRNGFKFYENILNIDTAKPHNPENFTTYSHLTNHFSNNNTISISWQEPYDLGSGVDGYLLKWSDTPGDSLSFAFDYYTSSRSNKSYSLDDGDWYFYIQSKDNFGNWNETNTVVGPFRIDTQSPVIFINSPSPGNSFGSNAPNFDITIQEENNDTFWYTLDGGETNITLSETSGKIISEIVWDSLSEGTVNITFYASDSAGNIGSSTTLTIIKDLSVDNQGTKDGSIGGYDLIFIISISAFISIIILIKKNE